MSQMVDELDEEFGWEFNQISSENSSSSQLRLRSIDSIDKSFNQKKQITSDVDLLIVNNYLSLPPRPSQFGLAQISIQEQAIHQMMMQLDGLERKEFSEEKSYQKTYQKGAKRNKKLSVISLSHENPVLANSSSIQQNNSNHSSQYRKNIFKKSGGQQISDSFAQMQKSKLSISNPSFDSLKITKPKVITHQCLRQQKNQPIIECNNCLYSHQECFQGICSPICIQQKNQLPQSQMVSRIYKSNWQTLDSVQRKTNISKGSDSIQFDLFRTCFDGGTDPIQEEINKVPFSKSVHQSIEKQKQTQYKNILQKARQLYKSPIKYQQKKKKQKNEINQKIDIVSSLNSVRPIYQKELEPRSQIKCTCRNCECNNFSCNCRRWNMKCNQNCQCIFCKNDNPLPRILLNSDQFKNQICIESEVIEVPMHSQSKSNSSESPEIKFKPFSFSSPS